MKSTIKEMIIFWTYTVLITLLIAEITEFYYPLNISAEYIREYAHLLFAAGIFTTLIPVLWSIFYRPDRV